jgi:hypothetical protein
MELWGMEEVVGRGGMGKGPIQKVEEELELGKRWMDWGCVWKIWVHGVTRYERSI